MTNSELDFNLKIKNSIILIISNISKLFIILYLQLQLNVKYKIISHIVIITTSSMNLIRSIFGILYWKLVSEERFYKNTTESFSYETDFES